MNSRELARFLVLGGVLTGLTAGSNLRADQVKTNSLSSGNGVTNAEPMAKKTTKVAADKHACKGMNSCKGKGNCKSGNKGCAGKNSCKGKGGCASESAKHDCKGKNACKGLGPDGKNACKGKGGCAVPAAKAS